MNNKLVKYNLLNMVCETPFNKVEETWNLIKDSRSITDLNAFDYFTSNYDLKMKLIPEELSVNELCLWLINCDSLFPKEI